MKRVKLCVLVFCVVLFVALIPSVVSAEVVTGTDSDIEGEVTREKATYIDSDIEGEVTWEEGIYYICKTAGNRQPKVIQGSTLTIASGSKVYFGNRVNVPIQSTGKFPYSNLEVNGTLNAEGVTFSTVPDGEGETAWKDAGWQGIIVKSLDSTNTAGASFTGCAFTNSKGEGTLRGVDTNEGGDGQTINITVNNCTFEDPIGVGSEFAAAISYKNGYHLAGAGTLNVSDTTITDYNRGIIVQLNQRDDIDISIDGCTFNNIAKEPVRLESGRSAVLQNCTFNGIKSGMERIVEIFYSQNERSSADQTVTISGNTFNGDGTTDKYPIVIGANAKINENIDGVPSTFSRTYPKAYRYIRFNGGIGSISTTNPSVEHAIWGHAGTPYLMTNSVKVFGNGAKDDGIHSSLEIKPGVTVNLDLGVNLSVIGALAAEGKADKHITFRKKPGADWCFGLEAGGSLEGPVSLKYCDFMGLNYGIIKMPSTAATPPIEIENCTILSDTDAQDNLFTDVSEKDWFYNAVSFAYENGLMTGTGDKTFSPAASTSRSMIVTILWRLEGEPDPANPGTFADVAEGKWYSKAVAWAAGNGIVDGYSADKFGPEDIITHEQMVKILYSYADYKKYNVSARGDLSAFTDSPSGWALEYMQWAVAEGLLQGNGNDLLGPRGNTTRSECAVILQRFIENYNM
jgi:hypothetical protein